MTITDIKIKRIILDLEELKELNDSTIDNKKIDKIIEILKDVEIW